MKTKKEIGYWAEGRWDSDKKKWVKRKGTQYPMPVPRDSPWKGEKKFLMNLKKVVDSNKVAKSGFEAKGFSRCRLCGKINGPGDYSLEYYQWPDNLFHYVKKHNIKPDEEFIEFINNKAKEIDGIDNSDSSEIYVIRPRTKNRKSYPNIIDTTSRSNSPLSPFLLKNIQLYNNYVSKTMENAWQYSKVYSQHIKNGKFKKKEYLKWAKEGWNKERAVRHPMGKGAKPEFSYWDGLRFNYIEARKNIYIPLYARAVVETNKFQELLERVEEETITLWDFDGYDYVSSNMTLEDVLHYPNRPMGHAFVLAMLLKGHVQVLGEKVKVFGYVVNP